MEVRPRLFFPRRSAMFNVNSSRQGGEKEMKQALGKKTLLLLFILFKIVI